MNKLDLGKFQNWLPVLSPYLLLTVLSALVFVPHALRLGFYRDDWYYIADGYFGGAKIFHTMFWIDRPARGYLFELLFTLFGLKAINYHLLMWVWRCSAGIFSFALFNALWPSQRSRNLGSALIFILYPGFLWWVSGVEYQPMLLSLATHTASIWLSILFIRSTRLAARTLLFFLALCSGWASLWMVDYAIGMEVFRLVCIYFYFREQGGAGSRRETWRQVLLHTYVSAIVMGGFLAWRLLFFTGVRLDTDIGFQVGKFLQSPTAVGVEWLINLARSFYSVLIAGWYTSLQKVSADLGVAEKTSAIVLALLFLLGLVISARRAKGTSEPDMADAAARWGKLAIVGGVVGVLGSLVPIIVMNRVVTIHAFSHYALPASLPLALIVVGGLAQISQAHVRTALALCLLTVSALSIHTYAFAVYREEQAISEFWRQFSLRAPGLAEGTTLLVNYPGVTYGEENDIVWGPANFVYLSPQDVITTDGQIVYPLAAAKMQMETYEQILQSAQSDDSYRSHALMMDFGNLLVASQPTAESCVHVLDSRWPRINQQDSELVVLAAEFSRIDTVSTEAVPQPLNSQLFGEHQPGWCSYYQQAELALQRQDWPGVLRLLIEAQSSAYGPADPAEWLPFVQAAILMDDHAVIASIASESAHASLLSSQVLDLLPALTLAGYKIDAQTQGVVQQLFTLSP